MASKFPRGATAYSKDGTAYIVEDVEAGLVYCSAENGVETEFPEATLMTESEWTAKTSVRRDVSYAKLRISRAYSAPVAKLDKGESTKLLAKVERLSPGLLDFTAMTVAARILADSHDHDQIASLSVKKCRALFDASSPDVRAGLLAGVLGVRPDIFVGMANVGDFLMQAMIDKGLAAHGEAYDRFCDRPRT
ncbi:MAG: hypothetical protein SFV19_02360 [Rhodospirillaceae bacterium]|nr:hypothetical protein [Rhodospirillaceae bacterium]